MKKYEISEEELRTLIGVAAARTCDDEEFSGHDDMVMRVAAVIACKLTNRLNGKAPFPEEELEITRKTAAASREALAILSFLFGGCLKMYYNSCPLCGANLDPGESCDCQEQTETVEGDETDDGREI